MPDVEMTQRFFDAIAPRYDRLYARSRDDLRMRMTRVLASVGSRPSDVLDLGVGTGPELHHLLDGGHRVVGVDVSEEMIALCKRRARPIPCVRADFWQRLPFDDASFDAVIALFGSLAHAPNADAYALLADEVARVLRPRGVFYTEAPTAGWAAEHPMFEDAKAGVRIAIVAPTLDAWRSAFGAFELEITEDASELTIVARRA